MSACAGRAKNSDLGEPWSSYQGLAKAMHQAAHVAATSTAADGDLENAAGAEYLVATTLRRISIDVYSDPDHPVFRPWFPETARFGLVNPDNLVASTLIRGDAEYLIRGTRGTTADLVFQTYEGIPGAEGRLRAIATLDAATLAIGSDGGFEIVVGPEPREGNWLRTDETAGFLVVRWSYSDWQEEERGTLEVVRIGGEGAPSTPSSTASMSERLRVAAKRLTRETAYWIRFREGITSQLPANTVPPPIPTGEQGIAGQAISTGHFAIDDEHALVVTTHPSKARYQGFQLGNMWFDSLEWENRQTSLSAAQAHRSSDGLYRFVISRTDPGVPNWLDTTGLDRGLFLLRWQGLPEPIPPEEHPTAKLVRIDEVRREFPEDEPRVDAEARREQLARRQMALQRRYDR